VKVGLVLPLFSGDPAKVLAFARHAEDLGYDGVFAFDHFFPPGAPRDRASLEAFSILAAVAAATERIAIGTLVTRASLRPAGLLAKLAVSLDDLSGGRMILGIGTGDPIDEPEHDAYGLPYLDKVERRAHVEMIDVINLHAQPCEDNGQRLSRVSPCGGHVTAVERGLRCRQPVGHRDASSVPGR